MNKDLDRIVLNLTTDRVATPVTIASRPDGHVAVILTEAETGSDTEIQLYPRQWKAVYQAIRWLTRGDTPWPVE